MILQFCFSNPLAVAANANVPIILSASTLRNSGSQAPRPLCSTSTPSPRKTADVLSAHIGNWLDRDRKGDRRRQFTIVGHNLLCHGITHFLMDVDTFWPKFTVAHSPVLLAWYSLILHGWSLLLLGLILLHLLGCWLLLLLILVIGQGRSAPVEETTPAVETATALDGFVPPGAACHRVCYFNYRIERCMVHAGRYMREHGRRPLSRRCPHSSEK